jgi:hypothetical protein
VILTVIMAIVMAIDVQIGDVVQTRKAHPCGSDQWQVYRIGADIGLHCLGCDRRVMLPRRQFEKSLKKLISRQAEQKE